MCELRKRFREEVEKILFLQRETTIIIIKVFQKSTYFSLFVWWFVQVHLYFEKCQVARSAHCHRSTGFSMVRMFSENISLCETPTEDRRQRQTYKQNRLHKETVAKCINGQSVFLFHVFFLRSSYILPFSNSLIVFLCAVSYGLIRHKTLQKVLYFLNHLFCSGITSTHFLYGRCFFSLVPSLVNYHITVLVWELGWRKSTFLSANYSLYLSQTIFVFEFLVLFLSLLPILCAIFVYFMVMYPEFGIFFYARFPPSARSPFTQ